MAIIAEPHLVPIRYKQVIYDNGMRLFCNLTNTTNPQNITFTWQSCDPLKSCSKNSSTWTVEATSDSSDSSDPISYSSLPISSKPKGEILYRCTAKNAIGMDQVSFEVIFQGTLCKIKEKYAGTSRIVYVVPRMISLQYCFEWSPTQGNPPHPPNFTSELKDERKHANVTRHACFPVNREIVNSGYSAASHSLFYYCL